MKGFKLLFPLLILTGCCTTPYQPVGWGGGYSNVQLDSNTIKVSFRGNGYTSRDTVENYLLYRCAETTVQHGYDYFMIVDSSADVKHGSYTTPGSYRATTNTFATGYGYGTSTTSGTYSPGQTITYRKHSATAIIKMFEGEKPQNLTNAYNARELMGYLSSHIRR